MTERIPAPSLDRVRPRTKGDSESGIELVNGEIRVPDREGKRALFSASPEPPSFGAVALVCTKCESRSVVSWTKALQLSFPGVPGIAPGSGVRIWMRCPSCSQRAWVELSLRP